MEILGIGTEIVECPRIGSMIEQHGEAFLRRVYTAREVRFCQSRNHALEHFAGRWAAKQAILKAIGPKWSRGISWADLEIRDDESGQPLVRVGGTAKEAVLARRIGNIMVSISHCRTYATASAIVLKSERPSKKAAEAEPAPEPKPEGESEG